MNCKIDYIENDSRIIDKERYSQKHRELVQTLYNHRVNTEDGNTGYRTLKYKINKNKKDSGVLEVAKSGFYYEETVKYINSLNDQLRLEYNLADSISPIKLVDSDTSTTTYKVSIDVRSLALENVDIDEDINTSEILRNYFGESAITQLSEEFTDVAADHESAFKRITGLMKSKLSTYIQSTPKGDYRIEDTNKKLKTILGVLKDESTSNMVEGISKYIVMGGQSIKNLRERTAFIKDKLDNLSSDKEERDSQLAEISKFVQNSAYYYHLFTPLNVIQKELTDLKLDPKAIDSYERDILESKLRNFITELGQLDEENNLFSEQEILDILNEAPARLESSGDFFVYLKELYKSKLGESSSSVTDDFINTKLEEFNEVLDSSMTAQNGVYQKLINTLSDYRPLQSTLKDLHYEVLSKILHPVMNEGFSKMNLEDQQISRDKEWWLSEEDFKDFLKQGGKDISLISYWFSAGVNMNDLLVKTVALYLKEIQIKIDILKKERVSDLEDFLYKNKFGELDEAAQEKIHQEMIHENLVLSSTTPVDNTYEDETITLNLFGETQRFPAERTLNLLNDYDNIKYDNLKEVFKSQLDSQVQLLTSAIINNGPFAITAFKDNSEYINSLIKMLYERGLDEQGNPSYVLKERNVDVLTSGNPKDITKLIHTLLQSSFYQNNLEYKSALDANILLQKNNIFTEYGEEIDLNDELNSYERNFVSKNSYFSEFNEDKLKQLLRYNKDAVFKFNKGNANKILVKYEDGTLGYLDSIDRNFIYNDKKITHVAMFSGKFKTLNKTKYSITESGFDSAARNQWKSIRDDKFKSEYFDKLIDLYREGNYARMDQSLQQRQLPFVPKKVGRVDKAKDLLFVKGSVKERLKRNYEGLFLDENMMVLKNKEGQLVDNEDNVLPEGSPPVMRSMEKEYINGQKIRNIPTRFNSPIPINTIDTNLFRNILLFNTESLHYGIMKRNESSLHLLRSVIEGDSKLDIDPRRMEFVDKVGNPVFLNKVTKKVKYNSVRVNDAIINNINDVLYNSNDEDFGIGGSQISAKKVANALSSVTGYMVLAWNISTMPSNYLISLVNERSVAEGNEFWNKENYYEGIRDYFKAVAAGDFFQDFASKGGSNEKSFLTQIAITLDAMQGEFISPQGIIERKNLAEKFADSALFWTQELPEHANQFQSMIMLMKGHKLASGISLYKALEETNKNFKRGDRVKWPDEFTKEQLIDFRLKLQGVNRIVHGNYAKQDKTNMQRTVIGNLMMTFKKYIYDGFRSRFEEETPDLELRKVSEGYFRTYLKAINSEFVELQKTQGWAVALQQKGLKTIGNTLLKTTLGGVDAATQRIGSNQSGVKDFLYGDNLKDRQIKAMMRSTYEIGMMMTAMLTAVFVEAIMSSLDDDDEKTRKVLSYIDLYSLKIQNDLGLFISPFSFAGGASIPGMVTLDQFFKLMRDPFVAYRSVDNSVGLFRQMFLWEIKNDEDGWSLSPNILDQYDKGGRGYEKGDYKIVRKFQKSIFAPYWQILRLMTPEDQLSYMALTFKNSN